MSTTTAEPAAAFTTDLPNADCRPWCQAHEVGTTRARYSTDLQRVNVREAAFFEDEAVIHLSEPVRWLPAHPEAVLQGKVFTHRGCNPEAVIEMHGTPDDDIEIEDARRLVGILTELCDRLQADHPGQGGASSEALG